MDNLRTSGGDSQGKLIPSPRILFIDDDPSIREKVGIICENYNYSCSILGDPLEALGQSVALKPALILGAIALPKLDGYQLCHLWRQTKTLRHTPIIMLTSQEGLLARVKAKMVGATNYLSKPFSENELLLLPEKYVQGDRGVGSGETGEKADGVAADGFKITDSCKKFLWLVVFDSGIGKYNIEMKPERVNQVLV